MLSEIISYSVAQQLFLEICIILGFSGQDHVIGTPIICDTAVVKQHLL